MDPHFWVGALAHAALLVGVSYLVLSSAQKSDAKGMLVFGWVAASFLWLAAFFVLISATNCGGHDGSRIGLPGARSPGFGMGRALPPGIDGEKERLKPAPPQDGRGQATD